MTSPTHALRQAEAALASPEPANPRTHCTAESPMIEDPQSSTADPNVGEQPAPASDDDGWEWMLVEVLGHRRHSGRVREVQRFGATLLRIDVPIKGDADAHGWQTHFYAPASLYGLTPCTREAALKANRPYAPPARYAIAGPDEAAADDDIPF